MPQTQRLCSYLREFLLCLDLQKVTFLGEQGDGRLQGGIAFSYPRFRFFGAGPRS